MAKEKPKNQRKRRFYKRKGLWVFLFLCGVVGLIALKVAESKLDPYREQASAIDISTIDDVEIPSIILDRHGREIGRMFVENRSKIPIEKVPQKLIDALLAQEDQRFFKHDGVDRIGVVRAVYLNLKAGEVTQGASTITMQLARNAFDLKRAATERDQSSLERKIVEAFLALRIEEMLQAQIESEFPDPEERKKQMKRMVLEYYLNRIPFGSGYYGIRSAALGYFGKEPMDLSIEECASLVACVKNPTVFSPVRDLAKNRAARDHVLNRMLAEGTITDSEWIKLTTKPVELNQKPLRKGKSHLYEIVDDVALEKVGIEAMSRGGFRIFTTIDRDMQVRAEQSLREQLDRIEREAQYGHARYRDFDPSPGTMPPYLQGAVLMIDSASGQVLAHVGGRDYAHSQYDFVVHGNRPFGTAFLPMIYTAALAEGRHPCTTVKDEAMDNRAVMVGGREGILGEWGMEIVDPQYEGDTTSRRALATSKIAASVRLGLDVGLEKVAAQAKAFGLSTADGDLLSRSLLGWDLVSLPETVRAYSAFSQGGKLPPALNYIERIESAEGEVVYQAPDRSGEADLARACDEVTAYQMHDLLREAVRTGNLREEAGSLDLESFPGAVKTGTTHAFSDGWCVGYNGTVSLGIWVGFHQGGNEAIYPNAFGRKLAFDPWVEIMAHAQAKFAGRAVERPESLQQVKVCSGSGLLATRYCYEPVEHPEHGVSFRYTGYTEWLRADREELGLCDVHGKGGIGTNEVLERYGPQAIDAARRQRLAVSPIRPRGSGLIGEDPYESELVSLESSDEEMSIFIHGPSLSLDADILGESDNNLRLRRPKKIEIKTD